MRRGNLHHVVRWVTTLWIRAFCWYVTCCHLGRFVPMVSLERED